MRSRLRADSSRTFGFDAPADNVLTHEQATGFRAQMAQLNDTELSIEMYGRVVEARPLLFDPNTESLKQELAGVSQYLRRVPWSGRPTPQSWVRSPTLAGWKHFGEFVGYDDESSRAFGAGIAEPLTRIELMLMNSVSPSTASQSA